MENIISNGGCTPLFKSKEEYYSIRDQFYEDMIANLKELDEKQRKSWESALYKYYG